MFVRTNVQGRGDKKEQCLFSIFVVDNKEEKDKRDHNSELT